MAWYSDDPLFDTSGDDVLFTVPSLNLPDVSNS